MPSQEQPLHKILKSHREQKRLSLHSIHQETRIPVIYLEAMEAGDWKKFPAEVYLFGFLKKYAKYLGLVPDDMVAQYKKENEVQAAAAKPEDVKKTEHAPISHEKESDSFVKGLVFAILILLVGVWWIYTVFQPSKPKTTRQPAMLESQHAAAPLPEEAPVESSRVILDVYARETVWVRLTSDQVLIFEGFLAQGTTRQCQAEQELFVRVGNVKAVELTLNGRRVDPSIGSVQSVGEMKFTKDSLTDESILLRSPESSASHSSRPAQTARHVAQMENKVVQREFTPESGAADNANITR